MATPSVAPGWYADPANQARYVRWWDGTTWTGHTHPVQPQPAPSQQSPPATQDGPYATTAYPLPVAQQQPARHPVVLPMATAGRSTATKVAIGMAVGVGALVLLLVLAAVAIPVFLNARSNARAARTSISMPATAAGLVQLKDSASQDLVRQALAVARGSGRVGRCQCTLGVPLVSLYGTPAGQRRALIDITRATLSSADQASFLNGARRSSGLGPVTWHTAPSGPLGGQVIISAIPSRNATDYVFADPGAAGGITVLGTTNGQDLAFQLRAAVEHRT